jgi:hypothetical protein
LAVTLVVVVVVVVVVVAVIVMDTAVAPTWVMAPSTRARP